MAPLYASWSLISIASRFIDVRLFFFFFCEWTAEEERGRETGRFVIGRHGLTSPPPWRYAPIHKEGKNRNNPEQQHSERERETERGDWADRPRGLVRLQCADRYRRTEVWRAVGAQQRRETIPDSEAYTHTHIQPGRDGGPGRDGLPGGEAVLKGRQRQVPTAGLPLLPRLQRGAHPRRRQCPLQHHSPPQGQGLRAQPGPDTGRGRGGARPPPLRDVLRRGAVRREDAGRWDGEGGQHTDSGAQRSLQGLLRHTDIPAQR